MNWIELHNDNDSFYVNMDKVSAMEKRKYGKNGTALWQELEMRHGIYVDETIEEIFEKMNRQTEIDKVKEALKEIIDDYDKRTSD